MERQSWGVIVMLLTAMLSPGAGRAQIQPEPITSDGIRIADAAWLPTAEYITNKEPNSVTSAMIVDSGVAAGTYTNAGYTLVIDADGRASTMTPYEPLECCMTQAAAQSITQNSETLINWSGSDPKYPGQSQIADVAFERMRLCRVGWWGGTWAYGMNSVADAKSVTLALRLCSPGVTNNLLVDLKATSGTSYPRTSASWDVRVTATNQWLEVTITQNDTTARSTVPSLMRFSGSWQRP